MKEAVIKAIDGGEIEVDLEKEGCYLEPSVFADDENLAKQAEQGNVFLGVTVTIDFSDRQEVVNAEIMKDWLVTDESGNLDLDKAKVKSMYSS